MFRKALFIVLVSLSLTSCMTLADYDFSAINYSLYEQNYEDAYNLVEADKKVLYGDKGQVLYDLDRGILSHYGKEYLRSNEELSGAEQGIYDLYATSVTQTINSFLMNDTVVDYSGEVYEDIYTNLFMALNYIHLDDMEDAFVEIRRFDNKLKFASEKYVDLIAAANEENMANGGSPVEIPSIEFHNSALARYISMILYRSTGKLDSALVDKKYIDSAFLTQKKLYDFPKPKTIEEELQLPASKARLNVIAFSGRSPIKREEIIRLIFSEDLYYKVAFPVMEKQYSGITSIDVTVTPLDSNNVPIESDLQKISMEKIESIENIAIDTFAQKQTLLYTKAIARSLSKTVGSSLLGYAASETGNDIFSVLQLVSLFAIEATERADVRTSRFFPGAAWVTGITLDPGEYRVTVQYKNQSGKIVSSETEDLIVEKNSLNVVESVCLK